MVKGLLSKLTSPFVRAGLVTGLAASLTFSPLGCKEESKSGEKEETSSENRYIIVTTDTTLKAGKREIPVEIGIRLKLLRDNEDFLEVEYKGKKFYISHEETDYYARKDYGKYIQITAKSAVFSPNIRPFKMHFIAPGGTTFRVLEVTRGFVKIQWGDEEYYVKTNDTDYALREKYPNGNFTY